MIFAIAILVIIVLLFKIFGGNKRAARRQELQMREVMRGVNPAAAARENKRENFGLMVRLFVFGLIALVIAVGMAAHP
jgi:hypothetical protein